MIITTTPTVEGRRITEYKGIVFGEVIAGVNVVKDIAASFSNFFRRPLRHLRKRADQRTGAGAL